MKLRERLSYLLANPPNPKFTTNKMLKINSIMNDKETSIKGNAQEPEYAEKVYSVVKKVEYSTQDQFGNNDWPRAEIIETVGKTPIFQFSDYKFPLVDVLSTDTIMTLVEDYLTNYYNTQEKINMLKKAELLIKTYRNEL